MRTEVLAQSLREQRRTLLAWAVGWACLVALYSATWPAVRENGTRYDEILADMPAALRSVFGGSDGVLALGTPEGYLRTELLSFTGPLLAVVLGLLLGSRAVAGEEDRGTLELLLAQPVSRRRVLLEQFAAAAAGLAVVFGVVAVGLVAFGSLVDLHVTWRIAVSVGLSLALLGLEAGALALLVGAATGRVGLARGVAGLAAVVLYVVHGLAGSVPALVGAARLSPFHALTVADPLRHGLTAGLVLQLLLPAVAFLVASVALFDRRDLAFT